MRGVPAGFFLVPLEHREIDDPQELKILRIEKLGAVVELLRAVETELPTGLVDGLFGPLPFGLASPGGEDEQVVVARSTTLADAAHGVGIIAVEALGVVIDAEAALQSESFDLIALLAARRAGSGNVDRDERQATVG